MTDAMYEYMQAKVGLITQGLAAPQAVQWPWTPFMPSLPLNPEPSPEPRTLP